MALLQFGILNKYRILLIQKTTSNLDALERIPLRLDSNVYLFEENQDSINVFEAYRIGDRLNNTVKKVGVWSKSGSMKEFPFIWKRRKNLQGLTVAVSASHVKINLSLTFIVIIPD